MGWYEDEKNAEKIEESSFINTKASNTCCPTMMSIRKIKSVERNCRDCLDIPSIINIIRNNKSNVINNAADSVSGFINTVIASL